jgi:hypothetical protein
MKKRGTIKKYQFPGTKCKIAGCSNPVFMSKTVGLCCKHKQRASTGRMLENGELVEAVKKMECVSCGDTFFSHGKALGRSKYCIKCKEKERKKVLKENSRGLFRISPRQATIEKHNKIIGKRYLWHLMKVFIDVGNPNLIFSSTNSLTNKNYERNSLIIEMRISGKTLSFIGKKFSISSERVRQIIKENT